jgi:hypothetical protein
VTIRWFTDDDRAERARIARERRERDELLFTFAAWLDEREHHDGPFPVPELPPETEARLIELMRLRPDRPL